MSQSNPFVVGQWVRGPSFYGRRQELASILSNPRRTVWLAGMRRVGKTSLLRQVELECHRVDAGPIPLYWDLQGAANGEDLSLGFEDALLDAGDSITALGVAVGDLAGCAFPMSLEELAVRVERSGRELLLLCDEAEELITLSDVDGELFRRTAAALSGGIRCVLASSCRLASLVEGKASEAGPLEPFAPPLLLAGLADDEAVDLIRQGHLPAAERPCLRETEVAQIRRLCAGHPYLLQLLCKRALDLGDLDAAVATVRGDRMVHRLFAVDLELLPPRERQLLTDVAHGRHGGDPGGEALARLVALGLVAADSGGEPRVANAFLESWLRCRGVS